MKKIRFVLTLLDVGNLSGTQIQSGLRIKSQDALKLSQRLWFDPVGVWRARLPSLTHRSVVVLTLGVEEAVDFLHGCHLHLQIRQVPHNPVQVVTDLHRRQRD